MAEIVFNPEYKNLSDFPAIIASEPTISTDFDTSLQATIDYSDFLQHVNNNGAYAWLNPDTGFQRLPINENFNIPMTFLGFENAYRLRLNYGFLDAYENGQKWNMYAIPLVNASTGDHRYIIVRADVNKYATGGTANQPYIKLVTDLIIADGLDQNANVIEYVARGNLNLNKYNYDNPQYSSQECVYFGCGFLKANSNGVGTLSEVPDYADKIFLPFFSRVSMQEYNIQPIDTPCSNSVYIAGDVAEIRPSYIMQELNNFSQVPTTCGCIDLAYMYRNGWQIEDPEEISPEVGPASTEEGYEDGSFDDSSDTIDLPNDPVVGVTNVGFVNVYKTGAQSLQNMGVELFPPLQYTAPTAITGTDVTDAVVNGFNSIVTFLANIPSFFEQSVAATLINYIIDCHVLPVTPSGGTDEAIKVGYKTLTAHGDRLSNDYVTFNCGTINLNEYYNGFADFLTSSKLYLPFVGFVPARPEWFYRDSLNVTYKFNVIDGSFMAYVRSTGKYVNNNNNAPTIVGQYSGNACVHLPITGVTYSNMVSGLVGAGAGAVMSAAAGNVAGVATSALNATNLHGDMPSSNAYSSSGSFLGVRRPFLMIERPVSNYSKTYQKENGIPSNISKQLGKVTGFSVLGDIHLDGIDATEEEKQEIARLLTTGVIL